MSIMTQKRTISIIVSSLLIDLLAFTIILPLFPRLIKDYELKQGSDPTSFYYACQSIVRGFRHSLEVHAGPLINSRMDIILFGGFLGSLFSLLQFVSSPIIGKLSDRFGRRPVLLMSMIGNAVSMGLWVVSKSFDTFVLSRIVGGLTEGNVQMSIAMLTDITTPSQRSRALAWVGISFAVGFTVGPPLGAYLASIDLDAYFPNIVHSYSTPAIFALVLILIESVYMILYLPETKPTQVVSPSKEKTNIKSLLLINFLFLFCFSGIEFTLTFLTFDRFNFSHSSQGKLLACMGILSACIQGGYVRSSSRKSSEKGLALQGVLACGIGSLILAMAHTIPMLYLGVAFLAFTSGTVVTCLTTLVSLSSSSVGSSLGTFRSIGQLGRAFGPLSVCFLYWMVGSVATYICLSCVMASLSVFIWVSLPSLSLKAKVKAL